MSVTSDFQLSKLNLVTQNLIAQLTGPLGCILNSSAYLALDEAQQQVLQAWQEETLPRLADTLQKFVEPPGGVRTAVATEGALDETSRAWRVAKEMVRVPKGVGWAFPELKDRDKARVDPSNCVFFGKSQKEMASDKEMSPSITGWITNCFRLQGDNADHSAASNMRIDVTSHEEFPALGPPDGSSNSPAFVANADKSSHEQSHDVNPTGTSIALSEELPRVDWQREQWTTRAYRPGDIKSKEQYGKEDVTITWGRNDIWSTGDGSNFSLSYPITEQGTHPETAPIGTLPSTQSSFPNAHPGRTLLDG
ncbi:hypothetical protein QFC24_005717 [Naganishia onofrii]|uniref:Uncharacterized protein n=1 Tax=Naganishia onofrii TaxID=1851511 RepID=A0ACC2X616_9TREE|nr:hypothetical protein QFC24_005717 [Naganishia onofrii]